MKRLTDRELYRRKLTFWLWMMVVMMAGFITSIVAAAEWWVPGLLLAATGVTFFVGDSAARR